MVGNDVDVVFWVIYVGVVAGCLKTARRGFGSAVLTQNREGTLFVFSACMRVRHAYLLLALSKLLFCTR